MSKNLIIVTVDEMRGDCLGLNCGWPDVHTPNMDAFGQRGVNLTRHFTPFPKCVPARISLTTGRYTHTDGYRNIFQHLPASQPDLLSHLIEAGYQTALFGKNHCWENVLEASHTPPELAPDQKGHRLDEHSWTNGYKRIYDRVMARKPAENPALNPAEEHAYIRCRRKLQDEAFAEQADFFLRHGRDPNRPFYLHVNFNAPHPRYEVEEPWYSMVNRDTMSSFPHELPQNAPDSLRYQREIRLGNDVPESALREIQAVYLGMIAKVDQLCGKIFARIDAEGLYENSVVVFLSDHGDFAGQYGLWEKWDTSFNDCLTRVPCCLVAPGLPKGMNFMGLSDHTDIAPTLCALLSLPPFPGIQGQNLVPVLQGIQPGRDAVFANGGHEEESRNRVHDPFKNQDPALVHIRSDKQETYLKHPETMARAKMVRTLTHKLIYRETGDHELYDLTLDPYELHNRFADPALRDAREILLMKLLDWGIRTDTEFPRQTLVSA
ncbi:MAG: sulfatase-like hydrolase/transferase [Verrucomicrobia bacterium]|nr:sulfatase-like hydrolase/transferase [Verrucomicrobiota bacterium]MCH8513092.1 sulfatase-like hydrolase/transferase [Kiritimatiellia bacterium]